MGVKQNSEHEARAGKYRKKPVEVEAIQWKPGTMLVKEVMDFFGGGLTSLGARAISVKFAHLSISTETGILTVSPGEWIIRTKGGTLLYTCDPTLFEATYEAVKA